MSLDLDRRRTFAIFTDKTFAVYFPSLYTAISTHFRSICILWSEFRLFNPLKIFLKILNLFLTYKTNWFCKIICSKSVSKLIKFYFLLVDITYLKLLVLAWMYHISKVIFFFEYEACISLFIIRIYILHSFYWWKKKLLYWMCHLALWRMERISKNCRFCV